MSRKQTIAKRIATNKELMVEQLRKTPIVQVACEKLGISRATYYRWRQKDSDFEEATDKALFAGKLLVNDMAESQLIRAIKDGNMTSIIFWLKHHHRDYKTRVELSGELKTSGKTLTPEQEEAIKKALSLASLDINNN